MDINITLLGQMITFAIFIGFTMKFVWPPLMKVMQARQKKIADGLAAANEGEEKLELAEINYRERMAAAKAEAAQIVDHANHRAHVIVEESKEKARLEGERLIELAQGEIDQSIVLAKSSLSKQVAALAIQGAEKILQHSIDVESNKKLLNELVSEI